MAIITRTDVKQCDQCKHEWLTANENPKHCPNCKTRKWNRSLVPVKAPGRPKKNTFPQ